MVSDPDGFHGFWLNSAIRHMLELRINYQVGTIAADNSKGASIVRFRCKVLLDIAHAFLGDVVVDGMSCGQFWLGLLSHQAHAVCPRVFPSCYRSHLLFLSDDEDYNIQALSTTTFAASTETLGLGTPNEVSNFQTSDCILLILFVLFSLLYVLQYCTLNVCLSYPCLVVDMVHCAARSGM